MKDLVFFYPPRSSPEAARTKSVPIDGDFEILKSTDEGAAVRFIKTNNVVIVREGDLIFDRVKRKRSPDPETWYRTAVSLQGFKYPNGLSVVDVWSSTRVFLDNGDVVGLGYKGAIRTATVQCRPAYLKWRDIMKKPDTVADQWKDFEMFQHWYMRTRPEGSKRWNLRSVDGTYGPDSCGFDDRLDLPALGATILYGRVDRL